MKLTIHDRIIISTCIPSKGSYEDLIIGRDCKKKVDLSQEELKSNKVETVLNDNGQPVIKWENSEKEFGIEFTDSEKNFIGKIMKQRSSEGTLTMEELACYEKFVNE